MKTRIIISTFGPLHLIKSAEFLEPFTDIKVIQGWIPNKLTGFIIPIVSKIVGRDLSKSFKKRTPDSLINRNYSVSFPEFYAVFFKRILGKKYDDLISFQSCIIYGFLSKRYIKDAAVFHVRSGSGRGHAITRAKRRGMKVIVDHSIAHPSFMDENLKAEFEKNNVTYAMGMNSKFWQEVLKDCDEADCLLVNSYFVKNTFINAGYNSEKINVVYLGVRKDFLGLKTNYSISDAVKILFTGSFGFRKGSEYIFQCLQLLQERNFKFEMHVVGSFDSNEVATLKSKYKINNIVLGGHVPQDELKKYLTDSDMYLFPSLCEGCASSGMEAMASGLPVIATIESGLPIENNIDGIIIPSKNPNAMVDAIIQLSSDIEKRSNIGKNAFNKIASQYSWEDYAKNVIKLYE